MGSEKNRRASQASQGKKEARIENDTEHPPTYEEAGEGSSASVPAEASTTTPGQPGGAGPSIFAPFDFPPHPPAYSASPGSRSGSVSTAAKRASAQRPVAIPQEWPDAAAPFLQAYAPVLLSYGIPDERWRPFVEAASAFLQAKVSERALSHAADVGRDLGALPVGFGKGVAAHAKSVGRELSESAKKRDALGLVHGAFAGLVGLPVGTAMRAIGAALRLPGSTVAAVSKRPLTPRERTAAYLAVANRDWLHPRGLDARLLDSAELAELVRYPVDEFVGLTRHAHELGAENPLGVLGEFIAQLEFETPANLEIGVQSLWIVLVPGGITTQSQASNQTQSPTQNQTQP